MARVLAGALVIATAAAVGCDGPKTSITQVWSAPLPNAAPMRKIVVMATRMDEANRRVLEDSIVGALAQHGVQGVQMYKLVPEGLPKREQAEAAVRSLDADGILSANFKGTQEKITYSPGTYAGGFWGGYYGWSGGYGGYTDAYVYTDYLVNVETTLWDARHAETVVWSALTNTKNPSSGRDFVVSVTQKVIPALSAQGLIPPALPGTPEAKKKD